MTHTSLSASPPGAATGEPLKESRTRPAIGFDVVVFDTDDPPRLAEFYATLLGWPIEYVEDDWISVTSGTGVRLGFQLAPNHRPPTWPANEVPQQIHLDLLVTEMEQAAAFAESIGATRLPGVGSETTFWVFTDPSGHPFCLCV